SLLRTILKSHPFRVGIGNRCEAICFHAIMIKTKRGECALISQSIVVDMSMAMAEVTESMSTERIEKIATRHRLLVISKGHDLVVQEQALFNQPVIFSPKI